MATIDPNLSRRIQDLPPAATITGSELVPISQNGVTVKTTVAAIGGGGGGGGTPSAPDTSITSTQSGDGVTTAFNIAHGNGSTPSNVSVVAGSADAAGAFWVTMTSTNIVINYTVAPILGTNNLIWRVIVKP